MNIYMQWNESKATSKPHEACSHLFLLYSCIYQVLAFEHSSDDADEPFGHADLLAQFTKETQAAECLLQWLHHAATVKFPGMKPVQGVSQGSQKETLVRSHLDALCFSPHQQLNDIPYPSLPHYSQKSAPSPLSRLGGGHISSDWQQQQLQQRGVRTAADSRWPQHMNQAPSPFHDLKLNLKQRAHMKKQEWCKDTVELQKGTIF